LTAAQGQTTISVALNKKSAQKQKDQTVNNGFSQAVISFPSPSKTTVHLSNPYKKLRAISPKCGLFYFVVVIQISLTMKQEQSVVIQLKTSMHD
jgi:hypothetical protein